MKIIIIVLIIAIAFDIIMSYQAAKSYRAYSSSVQNQNQVLKELLKSVCKQESDKGGDDECSHWDL